MASIQVSKPEDQKVTFVELFFDLVFVFSITQVVKIFHDGFTWLPVFQAILVFWLVWWAWTQFTWSLNAANAEHTRIQIGVLMATGVAFFMAVGVPPAFTNRALWFAVPYVLVKIIGNALLYFVALEDSTFRAGLRTWFVLSSGGLAAVLIGGFVGGAAQYWLWGLAILLDVYAGSAGGNDYAGNLQPAHFAERHGLFVIIALGETLILAASAVSDTLWTGELLLVAVLAVAVTGALWWSYFHRAMPALEHAFTSSDDTKQLKIAVESYSFIHFLMLAGIIAYAAAIEQAIAHPTEPLPPPEAVAFSLSLILFVGGMGAALWRATGTFPRLRIILTIVTGVAVVAAIGVNPVISLGIGLIGITAIGVLEHRTRSPISNERQ